MIRTIVGSIFDTLPPYSILVHQCNVLGVMDAGLAAEVKKRWPAAYEKYHEACVQAKDDPASLLGKVIWAKVSDNLIICNAIGQVGISRSQQMTDCEAWKWKIGPQISQMAKALKLKTKKNWTIHMPDKIGCGLGVANVIVMHQVLSYVFDDTPVEVWLHSL